MSKSRSVRITSGNTPIGPNFVNPDVEVVDVVAMGDFIYAEPVPEPGVIALFATGVVLLWWRSRSRRRRLFQIEA